MRRRDFIKVVGYAAAWPLTVSAQQPAMQVIGYLGTGSAELNAELLRAFRQGLRELGYIEGQNLAIEYRWAEQNDRMPGLATDLVGRKLAVIVADSTPSVLALQAATSTIPIIFLTAGDPVALGLVASLNRPGGNLTGTTIIWLEMGQKWLQLLHDLVPTANTFALLVNPTSRVLAEAQSQNLGEAARTLGLQLHVLSASTDSELNIAFATLTQLRVGGLVIGSDAFFYTRITGRVLKGEKPADLPVVQSTKVQLVINLKTAKALGLTVPATLLATADEVIE